VSEIAFHQALSFQLGNRIFRADRQRRSHRPQAGQKPDQRGYDPEAAARLRLVAHRRRENRNQEGQEHRVRHREKSNAETGKDQKRDYRPDE
jgi:hypothetical protein